MKFWKILNLLLAQIFPEWREMFLSYKLLKKHLKLKYPKPGGRGGGGADEPPPAKRRRLSSGDGEDADGEEEYDESDENNHVADFIGLLEEEINKLNKFFSNKEEDYVIAWAELKDKIEKAKNANENLSTVGKNLVDLHGEMILLQTYSILNYTGLVKITKKHDKLSGALIRLPFIQRVLNQPFFSTDVVRNLVRECETTIDHMFSNHDLSEISHLESTYPELILLALRVLKEIRNGSSTVGPLSMPPMERNEFESVLFPEQAVE